THKQAKGLWMKPFPHYDALLDIYMKDRATGSNAAAPADEEEEIERNDYNNDGDNEDDDDDNDDGDEGRSELGNNSNTQNTNDQSDKRKRRRPTDGFVSNLGSISKSFEKFVDGTMGYMEKMAAALTHNHDNDNASKVLEELNKLYELTLEQVVTAANIIIASPSKSAIFLALPHEMRMYWVMRTLAESTD
ncbi:hypothetical protein MKX03_023362, partial [Papaver bracteatum]